MSEVWKAIKGYEGYYEVSNLGRVRSLKRIVIGKNGQEYNVESRILKGTVSGPGYPIVQLRKNGVGKKITVHRLVAQCFIQNPENKRTVNHLDGVKTNNQVSNLEWATHSENHRHALDTGLFKPASSNKNGKVQGENNYGAILTEESVRFIRSNTMGFGGNMKRQELASRFGVGITTIADVLYRRKWKHVI